MYIGLGLIVGGFCLFLYSQMRLRQLDIEEFKNQQLTESFNKQKNDSRKFMVLSNNGCCPFGNTILV